METVNLGVLFVLGIGIFAGLLGAWLFQRIRLPQVIGYIVIGLIIGESGLKLVKADDIEMLRPFNLFALGIIGFLVGGELKIEEFRKYAKQFFSILLGEGLTAFLLVGLSSGCIVYWVFPNAHVAIAAAVVFGAIASATDPASTIDVLWEYRARGVLTTSLIAIVALDDALAMTLYGLGTGVAEVLTNDSGSVWAELGKIAFQLGGALVLGALCSAVLIFLLKYLHEQEKGLAFAVGLILLLISIASYADMDVILAAMALGFILTNAVPRRSEDLFKVMRAFSVPIYVLFFVLVGARIGLGNMPGWLWAIVACYVFARSGGKMLGTYLGARYTGAEPAVRKYLGLGLFAQGGVAIGLSIMAGHHLKGIMVGPDLALGDVIVFGVTATTLIVQLLGPPMVKLAVKLANETGRNITAEDVIASWTVTDVMDKNIIPIKENETVTRTIQLFAEHDYLVYPVVDHHNTVIGILSLEGLKDILVDQSSWQWLLASDVMQPALDTTAPTQPLKTVLEQMEELKIDQMPVVDQKNGGSPLGMLDRLRIRKLLGQELLRRQHIPAPSV